jgi:hypothetical protein
MDPISVHGAKAGQPFTVDLSEGETPTIFQLHAALSMLIQMGYGGTPVVRADYEAGPAGIRKMELYDTSKEKERGELSSEMHFLLC